MTKVYEFDTKKYDFRGIIENFFLTKELENIYDPNLKFENAYDCFNTKYHKIYNYQIFLDKSFLILYRKSKK
jgi:hypothetical protein